MCKRHKKCKCVRATAGIMAILKCPMCGREFKASTLFGFCCGCQTPFKLENGWAHFSESFLKPIPLGIAC